MEKFYVVAEEIHPTLPGDLSESLGLIKKTFRIEVTDALPVQKKYKKAFIEDGLPNKFRCSNKLKDNYQGKINPARSIPHALLEPVKRS